MPNEKIETHYNTLEEYEIRLTEERYKARSFRDAVIEKNKRIKQLENALESAISLIKKKDKDLIEMEKEFIKMRDNIDIIRKEYPRIAEILYEKGYRYHLPVQDPTKLIDIIAVSVYFLKK